MTERVKMLRSQSLAAVPAVTHERGLLVTESSMSAGSLPPPLRRAHVFRSLMERQTVVINDGELIVGERGPAPKATSTYPELCCHTLEDLAILDTRAKISFHVSEETKEVYRERIIPFWKGKTMRERIFGSMDGEWKDAYAAGIFTEFMEQRAPGHTVLGGKLYAKGLLGLKADVASALETLERSGDPDSEVKRNELTAMGICADAVITLARRYAEEAEEIASGVPDPLLKSELMEISRVCRRVPAQPPESFREALQAYWFVHLGVITELNPWDAFNPGRLDQHLLPFYKRGIAEGTLTRDGAKNFSSVSG